MRPPAVTLAVLWLRSRADDLRNNATMLKSAGLPQDSDCVAAEAKVAEVYFRAASLFDDAATELEEGGEVAS